MAMFVLWVFVTCASYPEVLAWVDDGCRLSLLSLDGGGRLNEAHWPRYQMEGSGWR